MAYTERQLKNIKKEERMKKKKKIEDEEKNLKQGEQKKLI